jgi:hypothetical protein
MGTQRARPGGAERIRAEGPGVAGRVGRLFDKGLIGFDVGTGSRIVRPELLRLLKRGTNTTADEQFAFAA